MDSNASHTSMRSRLRHAFQSALPLPHGTESQLAGALRHTLQHPGSMVRAELAYRVGCSFSLAEERAEDLAIAIALSRRYRLTWEGFHVGEDELQGITHEPGMLQIG